MNGQVSQLRLSVLWGSMKESHFSVYILEFGNFDYRKWAEKPVEKQDEFWKAYEQWIRFMERDAALNGGQGTVFIADFEGHSLSSYASKSGNTFALSQFFRPLL